MNRKKKKRICFLQIFIIILLLISMIYGVLKIFSICRSAEDNVVETSVRTSTASVTMTETTAVHTEYVTEASGEQNCYSVRPERNQYSQRLDREYKAGHALLMNADTNTVVAYRNANARMYPASLTKIMTLIIAVENIEDLSDTVTITDDMVFPMIERDAARAGFLPGETPSLEAVLYGMFLSSGADAALAAAEYVSGSEKAFVDLMNAKAVELGLNGTHFTNVVGLHDKEHYSTATDMALILEYAIRNETCRKIISAYEYKVPPTEQNTEGLTFVSNFFSRMYGDEMPDVTIQGGKTGYTDKAGNCIESFAEINGETFILVMCGCTDKWSAIYDTLSIYSVYGAGGEKYVSSSGKR